MEEGLGKGQLHLPIQLRAKECARSETTIRMRCNTYAVLLARARALRVYRLTGDSIPNCLDGQGGPQREKIKWSQFQIARVEARSGRALRTLVTFHGSEWCSRTIWSRVAPRTRTS